MSLPSPPTRSLLSCALAWVLCACASPEAPMAAPGVGAPSVRGVSEPLCGQPDEGCACDPDAPPVPCHTPARRQGDQILCGKGTRYCRDGAWGACESLVEVASPAPPGALMKKSGDLLRCSPCDPLCFNAQVYPTDDDLNDPNSSGLGYVPGAGGVGLTPHDPAMGSELQDDDGDGVVNAADECPDSPAFRAPCDGSPTDDGFYHVLPLNGPTELDPIDLSIQIRTADVYFLMDTTGSMGGEISTLQADLTRGSFRAGCGGGIIGAIQCTIPDAWFGVGHFDDYPEDPYGRASSGDVVFEHWHNISGDLAAAQQAVNQLTLHYGADGPESQSQALWATATGLGLGKYLAPQTGCGAGRWGYPCFRDGTVPIVVLMTDAPFHNGADPSRDYTELGNKPPLPADARFDSGNDRLSRAVNLGDLSDRWVSARANLCGRPNRGTHCSWWSWGGEAYYRFTLRERTPITMLLEGSDAAYPTLTLLNEDGSTRACSATIGTKPSLVQVLDPGTYFVVVDNYTWGCGEIRLTVGKAPPVPPSEYPVTWEQTLTALRTKGVKVITVQSCGGQSWCAGGMDDARDLAIGTESVDSGGAPLIFPINQNGSGLSASIVDAIVDLADYSRMDVSAAALDNPATPEDERSFVESITAESYAPGRCQGVQGGSRFVQCLPGTDVNFRVAFRNSAIPPSAETQVFEFFVVVLGDDQYELQRIPVRIVVPGNLPTYPNPGQFKRDYDAGSVCKYGNQRPHWAYFSWDADIPAGTGLHFDLRTADTRDQLGGATPIVVDAAQETSPIDLDALFKANQVPSTHTQVSVDARLTPSPDQLSTPILRGYELTVYCVDSE